jgi:hypothetical protein
MTRHRPDIVRDEDATILGGCRKNLQVAESFQPGFRSRPKIQRGLDADQASHNRQFQAGVRLVSDLHVRLA